MKKYVPTYEGTLRKHALTVPHCISKCSGIRVFGRRIKSLVFSTDVAIIKNINADAVIAVYPFTPQAGITQAIIGVSDVPVFVGVERDPVLQPLGQVRVLAENAFTHGRFSFQWRPQSGSPLSHISTMCSHRAAGMIDRSRLPERPWVPVFAPRGAGVWHGSPL